MGQHSGNAHLLPHIAARRGALAQPLVRRAAAPVPVAASPAAATGTRRLVSELWRQLRHPREGHHLRRCPRLHTTQRRWLLPTLILCGSALGGQHVPRLVRVPTDLPGGRHAVWLLRTVPSRRVEKAASEHGVGNGSVGEYFACLRLDVARRSPQPHFRLAPAGPRNPSGQQHHNLRACCLAEHRSYRGSRMCDLRRVFPGNLGAEFRAL
mmetsp:Transcript_55074/g.112576  ORF Transcript_55074/g.112576 Transcript_55074/m.112576 type:complete len:210 (-) Transcript_55074:1390-2019(-)